MKSSDKLIHAYRQHAKAVLKLLNHTGPDFQAEDFHAMRVHIKKLKAILKVGAACDQCIDPEKSFKPFEKLFRQAGKVRELQLQQTLMKKYKADPVLADFYKKLESDIQEEQLSFFQLPDKKLKKKLKRNLSKTYCSISNAELDDIKSLLSSRRQKIEKILTAVNLEPSNIHELRKRIKELYYLEKILRPKNKRLQLADDFQELLGQWHDYDVVSHDLLKAAQNHQLKPEEVKSIMSLQKKISSNAQRLLDKIDFTKAKVSL